MDLNNGCPVWGAIFMSNQTTKKECLRRNLFGLPYSQAHVVKQVKAGMMLFLFEYEERKLYGVFEALSDGAMNIEPCAYMSSGKQFSAQVRFERIWTCQPLSEPEFCVAIKDNYYTENKFNFLLSRDQVCTLLRLFSTTKIVIQPSQSPGISKRPIDQPGFPGLTRTRASHNLEDRSIAVANKVDVQHDIETVSLSHIGAYKYNDIKKYLGLKEPTANTGAVRGGAELPLPMGLYHPSEPHVSHMTPSLNRERNATNQFYNDSLFHAHDRMGYDPMYPSLDYPKSYIPSGIERSFKAAESSLCSQTPADSILHCSSTHLYHSPMDLRNSGVSSPKYRTALATSSEDYIGLTTEDDYDLASYVVPLYGSRYFGKQPDPTYCDGRETLPEGYGSCVATQHHAGAEAIGLEEDRGQRPELFISYPPSSGAPNIGKRTVESSNPDGFTCTDYKKRSSVFSRLSGTTEANMSLTASDLMQTLSQRQKMWGVMKTYKYQHAFKCSKSPNKVAQTGVGANTSYEIGLGNDVPVKEDYEVPFCSYKRRRNVHDVDGKDQAEVRIGGAETQKKRRKLVRPSFETEGSYKDDSGGTHKLNRCEETAQSQQVDFNCKLTETGETSSLLAASVECMEEKRTKPAEVGGENAAGQVKGGDKHVEGLVQECLTDLISTEGVNLKSADGSIAGEIEDVAACAEGLSEEVLMRMSLEGNAKENMTIGLPPDKNKENAEHSHGEGKRLLQGPAPLGSVGNVKESCEETGGENERSPITANDSGDEAVDFISLELELNQQT